MPQLPSGFRVVGRENNRDALPQGFRVVGREEDEREDQPQTRAPSVDDIVIPAVEGLWDERRYPAGTDPEIINADNTRLIGQRDSVSMGQFQSDRQAQMTGQGRGEATGGNRAGAGALGVSDVFLTGFADEVTGRVAEVGARAGNLFRSEDMQVDPAYVRDQTTQNTRTAIQSGRENHPVTTVAGNLAGGIGLATNVAAGASSVAPRAAAATGTAMASRPLMSAAGIGALESGLYGVGTGETTGERAIGGATGSAIGALLGPATVVALGLGRSAVGGISNRIMRRGSREGAEEAADPAAVRILQRSGVSDDLRRNADGVVPESNGDFVAERLGARGRRAAAGIALSGGEAADVADDAIARRASGRADRVGNAAAIATQLDVEPNAVRVYHGTPDSRPLRDSGFDFSTASERVRGAERSNRRGPYFATDSRRLASTYADDTRAFDYQNATPEVLELDINLRRPFILDAGGRRFNDIDRQAVIDALPNLDDVPNTPETGYLRQVLARRGGEEFSTDDISRLAQEAGFDGLDIRNVIDDYSGEGRPARVFAAFSPDQIAEPGQLPARRAIDSLMGIDEVREVAKPLFNAADEVQGRVSPRMREIFHALNRAGVSFRNADEMAARSGEARVALSTFADDIDNLPDRIRLGDVRSLARATESEARRLNRAGEDAGELWNLARELRDQIGSQSPEYREAASMWRSAARDDEAFDLGAQIFRPGARTEQGMRRFAVGTKGPDRSSPVTQSERRAFLAGVADAIERRTGNATAEGNTASRLNTGRIRDRLQRFLGEDAADELLGQIDIENRQARFERAVDPNIGSATALRESGRDLIRRAQAGPIRRFFAEIIRNPLGAGSVRQGREEVASFIGGANDETLAEVARFLFTQGDLSNNAMAQAILQETRRRGLEVGAAPAISTTATAAIEDARGR